MSAGEVVHESATGGKKAGNLERYDLLPPRELRTIAELYTTEYAVAYIGGSFNELNNQLWWFWDGNDVDPETGFLRLALVAFQALELLSSNLPPQPGQVPPEHLTVAWYDALPAEPLRLLAHHYGRGAQKYDDDNWQKGYDWRLSFAAMNRHLWQHQAGQFLDEETGSPHLVAVVWHAITLMWFYENKPEFDTRTSTKLRKVDVPEIGELAPTARYQRWLLGDPVKPVIYISGPMTGMPDHNFPAFNAAAEFYRAGGYKVINPAELPGEGEEHTWEWYLRRDLIAMLEGGADSIALLPGWENSRGARLEHHVATALGLTAFNVIQDPEAYVQVADLTRNEEEADSLTWVDALNDIVHDLDDEEGTA